METLEIGWIGAGYLLLSPLTPPIPQILKLEHEVPRKRHLEKLCVGMLSKNVYV